MKESQGDAILGILCFILAELVTGKWVAVGWYVIGITITILAIHSLIKERRH